MSAYRNLVRSTRAIIADGKDAALDLKIGAYVDTDNTDYLHAVNEGWDVTTFFDGYDTVDRLRTRRAAGYEAAKRLRALTGHATLADIASMRVAGAPTHAPFAV